MTNKQQNKYVGGTEAAVCGVSPSSNIRQGWQCPKCGSILSPDKDHCPFCSSGSSYTITCQTYDVVTPSIGQSDRNHSTSMRLRW